MVKNKRKNKSILKIVLFSLLIFTFILIMSVAFIYKHYSSKINRVEIDREDVVNVGSSADSTNENSTTENDNIDKNIINIALIGADYSNGNGASDSTMILSIDTKHKTIKLCSLMRDIYLDLPGGGKSNLNYTLNDGGPALLLKTINFNFNLKIDKFVMVSLETLPQIIDSLGGVHIEVSSEEVQYINGYINGMDKENGTNTAPITSSGMQHLNGTQAAAYCRIRYTSGGDFVRTERQREVLSALFDKFKDISITEVPSLISDLLPFASTNMSDTEMLSIASKTLSMGVANIEQSRFPLSEHLTTEWTDMYHMIIDKEATTNEIHKFLYPHNQ